jgi:hypothetical protein
MFKDTRGLSVGVVVTEWAMIGGVDGECTIREATFG